MDGWLDGWLDGWTDREIDRECVNNSHFRTYNSLFIIISLFKPKISLIFRLSAYPERKIGKTRKSAPSFVYVFLPSL